MRTMIDELIEAYDDAVDAGEESYTSEPVYLDDNGSCIQFFTLRQLPGVVKTILASEDDGYCVVPDDD